MFHSRSVTRFVCRECRHASTTTCISRTLVAPSRSTSNSIFSPTSTSSSSDHGRQFSSSVKRHKSLATFTPTSSPALDEIFTRFRDQVFLPSVVSRDHYALIYKASRHQILTQPPGVSVTVKTSMPPSAAKVASEETIKLQPQQLSLQPNMRKSLITILEELGKSDSVKDWENIVPFLQGLKQARRDLPYDFMHRLIARANTSRSSSPFETVLVAVNMADSTGVSLSNIRTTHELMLGVFQQALRLSEQPTTKLNQLPDPKKAQRRMNEIKTLLEKDQHCGSLAWQKRGPGHADMRRDPTVLATQLLLNSLAEVSAVTGANEKPVDRTGTVASDVKKLLALLPAHDGQITMDFVTSTPKKLSQTMANALIHGKQLELDTITLCALRLANMVDLKNTVSKSEAIKIALGFEQYTNKIQARIDKSCAALKEAQYPPRGLSMYKAAVDTLQP